MLYDVEIRRTERYVLSVRGVEAPSCHAAKRIVLDRDADNEFENAWNELPPVVETEYIAKESDNG